MLYPAHNKLILPKEIRGRAGFQMTVHEYVHQRFTEELLDKYRELTRGLKTYQGNEGNEPHSFNSEGFRNPEIDYNQPSIVYLGCSITEGTGVIREHLWWHRLHQKIEQAAGRTFQAVNAGAGGTGVDASADILHYLLEVKKIPAEYVFLLAPPASREEFHPFTRDFDHSFVYIDNDDLRNRYYKQIRKYQKEINMMRRMIDHLSIMWLTAERNRAKFFWSTWRPYETAMIKYQNKERPADLYEVYFGKDALPFGLYDARINLNEFMLVNGLWNLNLPRHTEIDIALDHCHPGPNWMFTVADLMFDQIKEKINT